LQEAFSLSLLQNDHLLRSVKNLPGGVFLVKSSLPGIFFLDLATTFILHEAPILGKFYHFPGSQANFVAVSALSLAVAPTRSVPADAGRKAGGGSRSLGAEQVRKSR
jgi:hypothetical protein